MFRPMIDRHQTITYGRCGLIAAAFLAACTGPAAQQQKPRPSTQPEKDVAKGTSPVAASRLDAGLPANPCEDAIAMAVRVVTIPGREIDASYFKVVTNDEPFDFNLDGHTDCVLKWSPHNFLFIRHPETPTTFRYVGEVIAGDHFGEVALYCGTDTKNGLCNISGSEMMIHGETQTRMYAYDGSQYRQVSVRLSKPHPKFGP